MTTQQDLIGAYGPNWTTGVATDHVGLAEELGMTLRVPANRQRQYLVDEKGKAYPVLCGELVWIDTEDGRIVGRCGIPVKADACTCDGHAWITDPDPAIDLKMEKGWL